MSPFARPCSGVLGLAIAIAIGACTVGSGCGSDEEAGPEPLQAIDLQLVDPSVPFDRNTIFTNEIFQDSVLLDTTVIQELFRKPPYGRPSFLETYRSNGLSAAEAIMRAARAYRINPLVFVAHAQAVQGLVGESSYPFPPSRVEFVFRCGCFQGSECAGALAGFDRQVDCLGRTLRVALDEMATRDVTSAGWGRDKPSLTLDNVEVTPASEATAALYDYTPRVAEGKPGGTWVVWNLFNLYASSIDYSGPSGTPGAEGSIGSACLSVASCAFENATCATNYPGGLCTTSCTGACPASPNQPETFCVDFPGEGGFCLEVCNPGAAACREGYTCKRLKRFGATNETDGREVCAPD